MEGNRALTWRKSSRSGNNGGQCIEVAAPANLVAVRDSKSPEGHCLTFTPGAWRAFAARIKNNRTI
jgi:hypothetical protein